MGGDPRGGPLGGRGQGHRPGALSHRGAHGVGGPRERHPRPRPPRAHHPVARGAPPGRRVGRGRARPRRWRHPRRPARGPRPAQPGGDRDDLHAGGVRAGRSARGRGHPRRRVAAQCALHPRWAPHAGRFRGCPTGRREPPTGGRRHGRFPRPRGARRWSADPGQRCVCRGRARLVRPDRPGSRSPRRGWRRGWRLGRAGARPGPRRGARPRRAGIRPGRRGVARRRPRLASERPGGGSPLLRGGHSRTGEPRRSPDIGRAGRCAHATVAQPGCRRSAGAQCHSGTHPAGTPVDTTRGSGAPTRWPVARPRVRAVGQPRLR